MSSAKQVFSCPPVAFHHQSPTNPTFMIFGSDTDVGKTLISAGLVRSAMRKLHACAYIKPVQAGAPHDVDTIMKYMEVDDATKAMSGDVSSGHGDNAEKNKKPLLDISNLFQWETAVSPHLAALMEKYNVADEEIIAAVRAKMDSIAEKFPQSIAFVETAGGVLSPAPSGTLQADLYRPLRLPIILIGSGRLGGIGQLLSAYESLHIRGYDVVAVIIVGGGENEKYICGQLQDKVATVIGVPDFPPMPEPVTAWYSETESVFDDLLDVLSDWLKKERESRKEMATQARRDVWWPFTQHKEILESERDAMVIDSAYGDMFTVGDDAHTGALDTVFDGCASWWTQGVVRGQTEMTLAVAAATGRYSHVMFPGNIHVPAYQLCRSLLDGVGQGWAQRVFFSDNGSTAVELAMKMALRTYLNDRGLQDNHSLRVVSLAGCYHGDTLGAMEICEPNPFNARQHPWFMSRCLSFSPPSVNCVDGKYIVEIPPEFGCKESVTFTNTEEVFYAERDASPLASEYRDYVKKTLQAENEKSALGCLLIEPVLLGAGGMVFVDPLFQRILAQECRKMNLPVVFDEVFSGLWRLGVESARSLLHFDPDIACYGKTLTGGTVPMAVTLTSEKVFSGFIGLAKSDALLHGHSYAAAPIACAAAVEAYKLFRQSANYNAELKTMKPTWSAELTKQISERPGVQGAFDLGTVHAVELKANTKNYSSNAAVAVINELRKRGIAARSLGNVVYLMATPFSRPEECAKVQARLLEVLNDEKCFEGKATGYAPIV